MGGVDKGLQLFNQTPLVAHALQRLEQQTGAFAIRSVINANRNLSDYAAMGAPVWPDASPDEFAGPLAGFLTGFAHCTSDHLLTVPCDSPLFPLDMAQRLFDALQIAQADIAMASAPEADDAGNIRLRAQPVFCLMRAQLKASLSSFMHHGGRKIQAWTALHHTVLVAFERSDDDPRAFANANTLAQLQALQK
jgi:molybdenum cofactor guanylyltransferase